MTAPPDIPPDRSPDAPVTPARRLGRAAGRFSRPLLWALAGLGLAITLVPRSTGGDVREPDSMRGLSRITVDANAGSMWGDASPWHPRFLTVTALGPELPPDPRWPAAAGRWERDNDAVPYALRWYAVANPRCVRLPAAGLMGGVGADREGFYRLDAALNGGFFGGDPGPMCRVVGASVSLWSLVLPAAAWGAWRVRRGDRPRSGRAALRRRLARPWVWGLAGLGAAALVGFLPDLPDGRGGAVSAALAVNRGPAGVPHPRTLSARLDWVDPPPWALAPFCPPPDPPGGRPRRDSHPRPAASRAVGERAGHPVRRRAAGVLRLRRGEPVVARGRGPRGETCGPSPDTAAVAAADRGELPRPRKLPPPPGCPPHGRRVG